MPLGITRSVLRRATSTEGARCVGSGLVTILTPGSGMVQLSSATLDRGHRGASDT